MINSTTNILRILGTLLNSSWHGTAVSTGWGSSSSPLAALMLCLWLEATAGHGMNGDHSMPDGIGTWKLSWDTEFININTNTHEHTAIKTSFSVPMSSQFILEDLHQHEIPPELHTFPPLATCCLNPGLSLCSCHQPPPHWQWACSRILDCNYKTVLTSSTKLQQQMEKAQTWNIWSIHTPVRLKTSPV